MNYFFSFRGVIFLFFLTISCFKLAYLGMNFSGNLVINIIISIIFASLEPFAQLVLHEWKKNKNNLYMIVFCVYIFVFSIPSSVGFFNTELLKEKKKFNFSTELQKNNEKRIAELDYLISLKYMALSNESRNGYGNRSMSIEVSISNLTEERKSYFQGSTDSKTDLESGLYLAISKAFFGLIPADTVKLIMFFAAVMMLQFGLFITNPDSKEKIEQKEKNIQNIIEEKKDFYLPDNFNEYVRTNKNNFLIFLENLIIDGAGHLTGDEKISFKTGISKSDCYRMRTILKGMKSNGEYVFQFTQDGSKLNPKFSKNDVIQLITGF